MSYTINEVKEWFSPLKVLDKGVTSHLTSLTKYGDNLVKSPNETSTTAWTIIFGDCLSDVKAIPDNDELEFVKKYRKKFQENCRLSDDELNKLTKKEFVYLFAIVMPDIFNEEKDPEPEPEQQQPEQQLDKDGCPPGKYRNTYAGCVDVGDHGGGSKNKSRKRSTRKPRRSRRHRRRTTTRKYKKLYK